MQRRVERVLGAAERRIGHAFELGGRIDRRTRQRYRGGKPPPDGNDRAQGNQQKRQRRTKRDESILQRSASINRSALVCQEGAMEKTVAIQRSLQWS